MSKLTGNKHPRSPDDASMDDDSDKNLDAIGYDPQTIENKYYTPPSENTPTNPNPIPNPKHTNGILNDTKIAIKINEDRIKVITEEYKEKYSDFSKIKDDGDERKKELYKEMEIYQKEIAILMRHKNNLRATLSGIQKALHDYYYEADTVPTSTKKVRWSEGGTKKRRRIKTKRRRIKTKRRQKSNKKKRNNRTYRR